MAIALSVIVCTHNPRPAYLARTLAALQEQTLDRREWELLVVDNASAESVAKTWDLSWHPHGRHVREEQLGLTAARLCGIGATTGELLVFVDDDNVLSADFLQAALDVSRAWPVLGVWGGNIAPEFEVPPPSWTEPYWKFLAVRHYDSDVWSNNLFDSLAHPVGAGLCVRRRVAEQYVAEVADSPLRAFLDRRGNDLMSGGDSDIIVTAHRLGFGFGVFRTLSLTHLIAAKRLTEDYLVNLLESMGVSVLLLEYAAHHAINLPPRNLRFYARHLFNRLFLPRRDKRFYLAELRSRKTAHEILARLNHGNQASP